MSSITLPEGWLSIKIADVSDVQGGKRLPKGSEFATQVTAHPYLRVTDFGGETVDVSNLKYIDDETFQKIKNYIISKNDLYISIAGTIGLVGDIPEQLDGANLTENAAKICNIYGVEKVFLKRYLNSSVSQSQFDDKTVSSGQPKLALFRIRDCDFPLPPLAEQQQIAQKLDELLAQVDTLKTRLDAIPNILKRFRQSVLAAAVSGRLTEEWRNFLPYNAAKNKMGFFVGIDVGYAFKSAEFSDTGVKLLRGQNIEPGSLRWLETKCYPEDQLAGLEHLYLKEADIILAMDRPIVSAGLKLARVKKSDLPCILVQRVARFKDFEGITSDYLYLLLSSFDFLNYIQPNQTGSDIPHISGKQILDYEILVPAIAEQTEIVRRVEQLFTYADQIEQHVKDAQARVNHLTQSILAKAFRGELTADWRAQNPDLISGENSAAALLERIKAERALTLKPKRKTKT